MKNFRLRPKFPNKQLIPEKKKIGAPSMRTCNKRVATVLVILYVDKTQNEQDMTKAEFLKCLKEHLSSTLL